ncbi:MULTISPECIES: type IV pilus biogenesis protein PilM [Dickeya]|uniref:Type IV pilus biogenesis protein PilM n=1 Tax=Dickeya aquatica TaxID=1401087 RepID=A0A375AFX4_9GAMM|nr:MULTISPECIES: pilus assembly protein PilM [Dickeya]SLM64897.1 Type IV pilus biogenesis protein PilM [Dickeya aquatica]
MAYPIWQVGLDIQNNMVRALAVQRRRHGWQLRHWWQLPLPDDTLRGASLHHPEALCTVLRQWRQELPRYISLRLGFPASRVLQQRLAMPDSRLREPYRGGYIRSRMAQLLPVGIEDVALDYRPDPQAPESLLVIAARQTELNAWLHCLMAAGLYADIVEITPCALRCMAACAGLAPNRLLLHRFDDHWLWVSPLEAPLAFGTLHPEELADESTRLATINARYQQGAAYDAYLSASTPQAVPVASPAILDWPVLSAFRVHPPLPAFPAAFAIAAGLAVRPEDTPC